MNIRNSGEGMYSSIIMHYNSVIAHLLRELGIGGLECKRVGRYADFKIAGKCHLEQNKSSHNHEIVPMGRFFANAQNDRISVIAYPTFLSSRKAAFTLTELLITLGIIGIVVAMTMPSLIVNHHKKETVAKLKKAYSALNQAFRMSESFNGPSEFWDNSYTIGAEAYYNQYWKPYFNNPNICKTYSECGFDAHLPYKYLNGTRYDIGMSMSADSRIIFYLPDGTLYAFIIFTSIGTYNTPSTKVLIDINGGKKPNILGKDVFLFRRINSKGILPEGYDKSADEIEDNCTIQNHGDYCAARIINDGWEIKY